MQTVVLPGPKPHKQGFSCQGPFNSGLHCLSVYRTINELEAQLDYERLRREKLEAQLDQYRRDMAELSYRLQSREIDDSGVS